jgi:hypothetical protein
MDYMLTRWEAFARFLGDGRICLKALADKLSQVEQWRLLTIREHTVEIAHEQLATQWLRYHSRMARTRAAWSPKEKFGSMSSQGLRMKSRSPVSCPARDDLLSRRLGSGAWRSSGWLGISGRSWIHAAAARSSTG